MSIHNRQLVARLIILAAFIAALLVWCSGCEWLFNPNQAPVAVISANPISGEAPLEVTFDASESYDPDGDEISYRWDFGDGQIGQVQALTHTFSSDGNHTVQLTVTDTKGAKGVSSITIIVTLETVSDTIGISGGMVSTSQGSSVTVPVNTLADGSVVSISELGEPAVELKPTAEGLGNGILITLLSSNINTIALKSQSLLDTTPGIITIQVPLPSNTSAPSSDVITGCLLEFTAGDRSTQMVVGMDREGNVAKVSVPVELIAEFAGGALCNAADKVVTSGLPPWLSPSYWFSRISVRMFAKRAGHIPPILYRAESSSDFVSIGFIPTVNEASISYTSQDLSIIPIILIHGYKIARADEVAITASYSGTSPGYEDYAQTSWKDFIDYFYEHCCADLKKKLPAGYDFKLYVYRWDTDERFDKAGTGLARLINGCFENRPFILIGHSAGGIVARACVEHNQSLVSNFPGIITLASPHWGVPGASLFLDQSARDLENVVGNSWLEELNRDAKYTGKLITYGGFITNFLRHGFKLGAGYFLLQPADNDGAVPLYSALAEGYNVGERHDPYEDYAHDEMLHGKEEGSRLFKSICDDLQELAGELALPVAIAGDNQLANVGALVTLDGSASYDSQGHPLTFYWTQLGGPPMTLSDQTAMTPTFTPTAPGTYTFRLVANNGQMDSPPDDVDITVTNVNQPDLTVSSVNLSASSANPGDNVSVTFTVQNNGGPISGVFENRLFFSTTRYGGQGGQNITWGEPPMSLDGSTSQTKRVSITIPPLSPGNWYIGVYTDCDGTIDETNENNNINSADIAIGESRDHSPVVRIISPADGAEFTEGETITFCGEATDPEDGSLIGDSLYWTEKLQGAVVPPLPLGEGEILSVSWLSPGGYTITLRATDSDGNSSVASINITVSSVGPAPPPPGPSEGKIAFSANRGPDGGRGDIYLMDADGGNLQNITNDDFWNTCPVLSPDGSKIAFLSDRDEYYEFYTMNSDGNNIRRLTYQYSILISGVLEWLRPSWSPSSLQVAFASTQLDEIYVINVDGDNLHNVTRHRDAAHGNPSWSPDGSQIAFTSNRDGCFWTIYIMDADGGNQHWLPIDLPTNHSSPAWSPDGSKIAFVAAGIYTISPDGSNLQQIVDFSHCSSFVRAARALAWSPDGTKIAWSSNSNSSLGIGVMNADGSDKHILIEGYGQYPSWSR
ncbi:PD40 domain-containing protein [Candidatus Bipolaricaulota bacterium]|nr:PD40 domain-containing protein [Candidatus Bipolaricaulota bacterium]